MNPYLNQYKQNSVLTASPERILIMLYDGAINFLLRAKISIDEKNIEDTHIYITKTQKIIREFMNSLDKDSGGDIAENLFKLYEYLHHRLIQANIKKDKDMIDEVLNHLRELKKTWEEAIKISSREEKMNYYNEEDNIDRNI